MPRWRGGSARRALREAHSPTRFPPSIAISSVCVVVELSAKGARRAGELAERRALRGFDAIHLASALEVEQLTGSTPSFACFDDRLREAASAERLPV